MGVIKQEKLANGNIGLEIVYGGREAPFGGIDSSMPPPYIDPLCQVDVQGFVVINGQFVAVSFGQFLITLNIPSSNFTAPELAGFGSFYTEEGGYQNFVVINGDKVEQTGYYETSIAFYTWPASVINPTPTPIVLTFSQAITQTAPVAASAVVVAGPPYIVPGGANAVVTVAISDGSVSWPVGDYASLSQNAWVTSIVNQINTLNASSPGHFTAAVNADGISLTITSSNPGKAGNNDLINVYTATTPPPNTYSGCNPYLETPFQGGADVYVYPSGEAPYPLSFVSEGEQLILGGPGTVVLQYNDGILSILEQYVGANTLKKFGGSLLALGITPSPGTQIQSPEMVMAWSASGKFGIWNPTDQNGNVTGAGFQQIADIEDPLTGGFVNSSTLLLLRAKGISYGTVTGNATLPFQISHVDLAPEGEGCQGQLLSSQYGPVGFFVGNANVFQFIQQLQAIGDKIKDYLFTQLQPSSNAVLAASKAVALYLGQTETVLYAVYAQPYVFLYNVENGTWTRILTSRTATPNSLYLEDLPSVGNAVNQFQKQSQLILGTGDTTNKLFNLYQLIEYLPTTDCFSNSISTIIFPAEEISHGRDITVDGLYATIAGTAGQIINWEVFNPADGTILITGSLTLPAGASYSTLANYQLYDATTGMAATCQMPQLKFSVPLNNPGELNQLRIVKVTMFASYDPMQRPV